MISRARLLCCALPATALLAGCGTTTIDSAKVERYIRTSVTSKLGAKLKDVSCPSGLKAKAGDAFTCDVIGIDGSKGKTQIRQKDAKGNVNVNSRFLSVRQDEQTIAADIGKKLNVQATVRCPEIMTGAKGKVYRCTASAQGQKRDVRLTVTDDVGGYRYDLV